MAEMKLGKGTQILVVLIVLFALLIGLNFFQPVLKPIPLPNETGNELQEQPLPEETPEPEIIIPIEEPEIILVQTCGEQGASICSDSEECSKTISKTIPRVEIIPFVPASDSLRCCSHYNRCASIDNVKPSVSIIAPENQDQVSGYFVEVKATASDNVGVERVDFLIDGDYNATLTAKPYNFVWDTRKFTKGNHSLNVEAFDAVGNFSTASITVNLK